MLTHNEAVNSTKNSMKKCSLIMRKLREFNEKDAETLAHNEKPMWMMREFTKYSYTIAWKDDLKMFQMEN